MDRNLMKSINQIRNTARLDEIYQQSTAWIWTHVDEKVSRVTLFRVSQKRRLSKCCWSHDVPAKSPVAVAHSSQRPSWLKMIEPVSGNYFLVVSYWESRISALKSCSWPQRTQFWLGFLAFSSILTRIWDTLYLFGGIRKLYFYFCIYVYLSAAFAFVGWSFGSWGGVDSKGQTAVMQCRSPEGWWGWYGGPPSGGDVGIYVWDKFF